MVCHHIKDLQRKMNLSFEFPGAWPQDDEKGFLGRKSRKLPVFSSDAGVSGSVIVDAGAYHRTSWPSSAKVIVNLRGELLQQRLG